MFLKSKTPRKNLAIVSNLTSLGLHDVFHYWQENNYQLNVNPVIFRTSLIDQEQICNALKLILHIVRFHPEEFPIHELALVRGGGELTQLEIFNQPQVIDLLGQICSYGIKLHVAIGHAANQFLNLENICKQYQGKIHITPTAFAQAVISESDPKGYLNAIVPVISLWKNRVLVNVSLINSIANNELTTNNFPELAKYRVNFFNIAKYTLGEITNLGFKLKFTNFNDQHIFNVYNNELAVYLLVYLFYKQYQLGITSQENYNLTLGGSELAKLASKKTLHFAQFTTAQYQQFESNFKNSPEEFSKPNNNSQANPYQNSASQYVYSPEFENSQYNAKKNKTRASAKYTVDIEALKREQDAKNAQAQAQQNSNPQGYSFSQNYNQYNQYDQYSYTKTIPKSFKVDTKLSYAKYDDCDNLGTFIAEIFTQAQTYLELNQANFKFFCEELEVPKLAKLYDKFVKSQIYGKKLWRKVFKVGIKSEEFDGYYSFLTPQEPIQLNPEILGFQPKFPDPPPETKPTKKAPKVSQPQASKNPKTKPNSSADKSSETSRKQFHLFKKEAPLGIKLYQKLLEYMVKSNLFFYIFLVIGVFGAIAMVNTMGIIGAIILGVVIVFSLVAIYW